MKLDLDEQALLEELLPALDAPAFRAGLAGLTGDPFLVAFFLASVSQGEGLGEAAVGMIGHEELAQRLRGLERQQAEEHAHHESTIGLARELFPECFRNGRYRYPESLMGRSYYVAVLEENRRRLRERGCGSRLNVYLTTTFGYETMVLLLYRAVADAIAASGLPEAMRSRVSEVLRAILADEETHLGILDQHERLAATSRDGLSGDAGRALDALDRLEASDYRFAAELAVERVVEMMSAYADPARMRSQIEAGAAPC